MNKAPKLKNSDYQHIRIKHDMTKLERDQWKKLIEEAIAEEEKSGGKWEFRVRGPPWNMKIIKRKPKGADVPDTTENQMQVEETTESQGGSQAEK